MFGPGGAEGVLLGMQTGMATTSAGSVSTRRHIVRILDRDTERLGGDVCTEMCIRRCVYGTHTYNEHRHCAVLNCYRPTVQNVRSYENNFVFAVCV